MSRITENYQLFRHEIGAHWKTGAVMTGVAVVVGRVYGRIAALGVVLLTVSNYQIIGQQIRVFSWMSLRKTLIAVVIFGNSYYKVIDPQIMSYIAVALILIDNFQLSSLNVDLSTQKEVMDQNNAKLKDVPDVLKQLVEEVQTLLGPAAPVKKAQEENQKKAETLTAAIPPHIQAIPERLQDLNTLLRQLMSTKAMQEMRAYEAELRRKIDTMHTAFDGFFKQNNPLAEQAAKISNDLTTTVSNLQANVVITGKQIAALEGVLAVVQRYPRRIL